MDEGSDHWIVINGIARLPVLVSIVCNIERIGCKFRYKLAIPAVNHIFLSVVLNESSESVLLDEPVKCVNDLVYIRVRGNPPHSTRIVHEWSLQRSDVVEVVVEECLGVVGVTEAEVAILGICHVRDLLGSKRDRTMSTAAGMDKLCIVEILRCYFDIFNAPSDNR